MYSYRSLYLTLLFYLYIVYILVILFFYFSILYFILFYSFDRSSPNKLYKAKCFSVILGEGRLPGLIVAVQSKLDWSTRGQLQCLRVDVPAVSGSTVDTTYHGVPRLHLILDSSARSLRRPYCSQLRDRPTVLPTYASGLVRRVKLGLPSLQCGQRSAWNSTLSSGWTPAGSTVSLFSNCKSRLRSPVTQRYLGADSFNRQQVSPAATLS